MKKFLVVLLACAMIFAFATTALAADEQIADFNDIADQSQVMKDAIQRLAVLGVFQGDEGLGGAFRHGDTLTRAEFAKIVCLLAGVTTSAEAEAMRDTASSIFKDVTTGWYTGWVQIAGENGFFKGDTHGNFNANANITYQEIATVLLRVVGYDDHLGGSGNGRVGTWPENYNTKARSVGLTDNVTYVAKNPITRGAMALMADNALELDMVSYISDASAANAAIVSGDGDKDWFVEVSYETNTGQDKNMNVLKKAFNAYAVTALFEGAEGREFDETAAWGYEDFEDTEFQVHFSYERLDDNPETWAAIGSSTRLGGTVSLASNYYITRSFNFPDLANMYAKVTAYDTSNNEVCFIQVLSSTENGYKIYKDGSRVNVDGTSKTVSSHPIYASSTNLPKDFSVDETAYLDYSETDKDNTFAGKVYLDAEGRVYAVKNYVPFDVTSSTGTTYRGYGIFDKVDSDAFEFKNDAEDDDLNDLDVGDDDYIIYREGQFVKADELEENDVLFYAEGGGAAVILAYVPNTGDLTKYTSEKVTIGGRAYRVIDGHLYVSTDGGDEFDEEDLSTLDLDTSAFGDATYVEHYNFDKVVYVASAAEATDKIVGVVTDIEYKGTISGFTFNGITIYNSEGKEVSYTFESDFKDAYNDYTTSHNPDDIEDYLNIDYADITTYFGAPHAFSDYYNSTASDYYWGFDLGMIVELGIDKNGNISKVEDAKPFDPASAAQTVTTDSSRSRFTVPASLTGAASKSYYLDTDAVIFEVSVDAKTISATASHPQAGNTENNYYDSVSTSTVSSLLANDFDAYQVEPFSSSNSTGSNLDILYVVSDASAQSIGVISESYRYSGGWAVTLDAKEDVVADKSYSSVIPALITYHYKDGELVQTNTASSANAVVVNASRFTDYANSTLDIKDLADDMADAVRPDDEIYIALGNVSTTDGSGKDRTTLVLAQDAQLQGAQDNLPSVTSPAYEFLIEDTTYIYDLDADEEITVTRDLRNKKVMVVVQDGDVLYVLVGGASDSSTASTLLSNATALVNALGAGTASNTGLVTLNNNRTITSNNNISFLSGVSLDLNGNTLTINSSARITMNSATSIVNGTVILKDGSGSTVYYGTTKLQTAGGADVEATTGADRTYTIDSAGIWN